MRERERDRESGREITREGERERERGEGDRVVGGEIEGERGREREREGQTVRKLVDTILTTGFNNNWSETKMRATSPCLFNVFLHEIMYNAL